MAIIIPSKNIFEIKNPKIIENFIDSITVSPVIATRIDNENIVESLNFNQGSNLSEIANVIRTEENGYFAYIDYSASFYGDEEGYNTLSINKINDNRYINSCDIFFDSSSLSATITPKKTGSSIFEDTDYVNFLKTYQVNGFNGEIKYEFSSSINFSGLGSKIFNHELSIIFVADSINIQVRVVREEDNEIIINYHNTIKISEIISARQDNAFEFKVRTPKTISINYYWNMISAGREFNGAPWNGANIQIDISQIALKTKQVFSTFSIVNGDKIVIGNENGTNNYLVEDTPFIQSSDDLISNSVIDSLNQTLSQYANGKENATILCSISDYYNDKGNLVISKNGIEKMVFQLYDEVVPMIKNDTPLSLSSNGKAKTFALLGRRIYYDGAVWQELSLQEKGEIPYIGGTENLKYEIDRNGDYWCVGENEENAKVEIAEFIGFLPNVCYVKGIADYAFKHKQNLNQIILPKTIKYLGRDAFANCYNVKSIYYNCEDAIVVDADYQPFYRVGENADGTVFSVGTNVKKIPDNLFASEESPYARISEIYFYPNSQCESIGNTAFYECKDIQRVTAPVKTIGRLAFAYNTNLKELSLKNIIDIGDAAFAGCSLLYEIHFGKDLKHIGKNAFNNCYNFSDIYYEGSYEDWQKVVIESGNGNSSEAGSFMYTVLSPSMHFNSF